MDTGVERTHPDLNVVEFVDFVDAEGAADHNADGHGHGTHVGGEWLVDCQTTLILQLAPCSAESDLCASRARLVGSRQHSIIVQLVKQCASCNVY